MIKFSNLIYRQFIFQNAKNLRTLNVSFSADYTPEQQQKRKELKYYQNILKDQGKQSTIRGTRILVNDKYYDSSEIHMLTVDPSDNNSSDKGGSIISQSSTGSRKRERSSKKELQVTLRNKKN